LWKDLREDGEAVSEKRVRRLMRAEQISGPRPEAFKQTTNSDHHDPIAANVLARDFTAAAPNQRWVSDTNRVRDRGWCQAVSRRDSGSLLPVRGGVGDQRRERSPVDAEGPRDGGPATLPDPGLLHHSDRGCTYTCEDYQRISRPGALRAA